MLWLILSVIAGIICTSGMDENTWKYVGKFYQAFLFWWIMVPVKYLIRYYPHK